MATNARNGLVIVLLLGGLVLAHQASPVTAGTIPHRELTGLHKIDSAPAHGRVIIVLRQPPLSGSGYRAMSAQREFISSIQSPVLNLLDGAHARHVRAYRLINAVAATISARTAAVLIRRPNVQAIVPDVEMRLPQPVSPGIVTRYASNRRPGAACPAAPRLAPEALQLTQTAFDNSRTPQARALATGKGVTVAFLADGIDTSNPDFIRPDGRHVISDYKNFTGSGTTASTGGAEAFGDASAIAAQGRSRYNINDYMNAAHQNPRSCTRIRILGVAPGASLMALEIGSSFPESLEIQAIQYAVFHHANVINESFGATPTPDVALDPTKLANDQAIAHGITVVAITGDSGTGGGSLWSPGTSPGVINVGASTQLRSYREDFFGGAQLGRGSYMSNNISAISGTGVSQSGDRTVDVVAPGDLGWQCVPRTQRCTRNA